jgi:hypothetical protein
MSVDKGGRSGIPELHPSIVMKVWTGDKNYISREVNQ